MGKQMFYSAGEAAQRLGKTESQLKDLVRSGKLREFRDAGRFNYKVEEVDALAREIGAFITEPEKADSSGSGDIVLEPADDSSVEISPSGSDVVSLEMEDTDLSASGTTTAPREKEGTVIQSVGTSVFDDDELDEHVDPLAQTAVTDVAGLGLEGTGSGSGILELSRESDDTSLGAELLQEITGPGEGEATAEMGGDVEVGVEGAVPDATTEAEEILEPIPSAAEAKTVETAAAEVPARMVIREVVEYGPDAVSASLTAVLVVAVVVMWFAGLGAAALVREVTPGLLQAVYSNLLIFAGGALGAAVVAGVVTYLIARKRSG